MIKTRCSCCNKQITVKTKQYTGNDCCPACEETINSNNETIIIAGNTEVYHS